MQFFAEQTIAPKHAAALVDLNPGDIFFAKSYAEVMASTGPSAWLLGMEDTGRLASGCYGFVTSGRMNRMLRINSLPAQPNDLFWKGLLEFCSAHGIGCLKLDNHRLPADRIPALPGESQRDEHLSYLMDLSGPWESELALNHRRSLRRAGAAGLAVRRKEDRAACDDHRRLVEASTERRRAKGEEVELSGSIALNEFPAFVAGGHVELFQAVSGDQALSSVVILRAGEYAWGDSAGTSPRGMQCGASHFLYFHLFQSLRTAGVRIFDFGCAEPDTHLSFFKSRFGAAAHAIESATFYPSGGVRRALSSAAQRLLRFGR